MADNGIQQIIASGVGVVQQPLPGGGTAYVAPSFEIPVQAGQPAPAAPAQATTVASKTAPAHTPNPGPLSTGEESRYDRGNAFS